MVNTKATAALNSAGTGQTRPVDRPGDLVACGAGHPILYEVLDVEREGLLRVRRNNWAAGYTALVSAATASQRGSRRVRT